MLLTISPADQNGWQGFYERKEKMIICVSIVDKHKESKDRPGKCHHVGNYYFEIDYPADSHFALLAVAAETPEAEADCRKMVFNKLLNTIEMQKLGAVLISTTTGEIIK